jgi:hypothetical protein
MRRAVERSRSEPFLEPSEARDPHKGVSPEKSTPGKGTFPFVYRCWTVFPSSAPARLSSALSVNLVGASPQTKGSRGASLSLGNSRPLSPGAE